MYNLSMGFLKKSSPFLFGLGIFVLFFVTRFYNILSLPIFTDEAIYVRWSQIASNDAAWRFISLTDGKQPLFVWIAMILMKFIEDPLLAGRFVSVLAGLGSMVGIFFLTSEVFKSKKTGVLASFLYVLYPFSLVYDRMALYDSLVSMSIIWSLYFEVLLVRYVRLDLGLILGMIIGVGMLTKTNANFALILLPLSLFLFDWKNRDWKRLGKWFIFATVAVIIANAMYMILRLSPYFHIIGDKNLVFIYSFSEWLQHPFTYFFSNLQILAGWLVTYLTWPFLVLVVSSFFVSKKYTREKLLLIAWFVVPLIASAFFFRQFYPRFILFMTMPLLVLGAYSLHSMLLRVRKIWLKIIILFVFLTMFVINDFLIVTNFAKALIPKQDRDQFITGWPSGGGVKETVAFLQEKAKSGKIYVGTEGTFGLMPYALEIYLSSNPNIMVKGFWPISDTPPQEAIEKAKKMPTYFVFYQHCPSCPNVGEAPPLWPVVKIFQIEKEEKGRFYTLYQLKSQ